MSLAVDQTLVDTVCTIARAAGRVILDVYNTDFSVTAKNDASPVTEADQRAEALILEALRRDLGQQYPIVAEEEVAAGRTPVVGGGPFWLVDPLDGTKQFVTRRGEFTVNIALIEDGLPVFGVVHAPAVGATYWGSPLGAFAQADGGAVERIACRPVDCSASCAALSVIAYPPA